MLLAGVVLLAGAVPLGPGVAVGTAEDDLQTTSFGTCVFRISNAVVWAQRAPREARQTRVRSSGQAFGALTWTPWVPQKVLANCTAVFWSPSGQASARQQAMLSMKEELAQMHLASLWSSESVSMRQRWPRIGLEAPRAVANMTTG